jgi:hypothetical protein
MAKENSPEELTPLQEMVTEVLTARWRLGEPRWPFPVSCMRALNTLARKGLVSFESGPAERTAYVQFTPAGRKYFLSGPYQSPLMKLAEDALFLRQNGERPPGGNENWRDWEREAEVLLRSLLPETSGEN